MACPQGSRRAVDVDSFLCDPELSELLVGKGVWDTLRARLAQADDLDGFVAELTDVLEKVSCFAEFWYQQLSDERLDFFFSCRFLCSPCFFSS